MNKTLTTFIILLTLIATPAIAGTQGGYVRNPSSFTRNANLDNAHSIYSYHPDLRNYQQLYQYEEYNSYYNNAWYQQSRSNYREPRYNSYDRYQINYRYTPYDRYDRYYDNGRAYQFDHGRYPIGYNDYKRRKFHRDFDPSTRYFYQEDGSRYYYNKQGKVVWY